MGVMGCEDERGIEEVIGTVNVFGGEVDIASAESSALLFAIPYKESTKDVVVFCEKVVRISANLPSLVDVIPVLSKFPTVSLRDVRVA